MEKEDKSILKTILLVVITVVLIGTILSSIGTVGAGERGILLQFGAVQEKIFDEGLYFKIPFAQKVIKKY